MKTISKLAFHGDVCVRKVAKLPAKAVEVKRDGARIIVAHSETGHHHAVDDMLTKHFEVPGDPMVCYLQVSGNVDLVHHRAFDTHEALRLLGKKGDVWEVKRQREGGLESWRRVED